MLHERPELRRAGELAIPLPWEPLDAAQGNRYEVHVSDAANSWQSLEVMGVFKTTKQMVICGGKVTSGKIEKGVQARVMHGKEEVGTGNISSVQREKNEVREVFEGEMCGLNLAGNGLKVEVGDSLELFTTEQRARTLS